MTDPNLAEVAALLPLEMMGETALSFEQLQERFGLLKPEQLRRELQHLCQHGFVQSDGDVYFLSRKGLRYLKEHEQDAG